MRASYEESLALGNGAAAVKSASVASRTLAVAQNVCEKRNRDLDELIDDPRGFEPLVSDAEWEVLAGDELDFDSL
jgi:tubulin monoglycylase TTLL3/8